MTSEDSGCSVFVRTKESLSVEMNQMGRSVSHPDFSFPSDFTEMSSHKGAIRKCGDIYKTCFGTGEKL
jgi:hypothetical protein